MNYLSVKELQQELGISRQTLYRWINKKGFPVIRVGSLVRFDTEDVKKWLDQYKEVKQ